MYYDKKFEKHISRFLQLYTVFKENSFLRKIHNLTILKQTAEN